MSTAFEFNATLANTSDKIDRQLRQKNRFVIIDRRTVSDPHLETKIAEQLPGFEFRHSTGTTFPKDVLGDHGLAIICGDNRCVASFEGSFLSNFEKVQLELYSADRTKKATFDSVEHLFQQAKGSFVSMTDPSTVDKVTETLGYLAKTTAPDYMVKISRTFPMSPEVIAAWREINIDVLECIVAMKMDCMPQIREFFGKIAMVLGVEVSDIEFWEANKHDDIYGTKMDLVTCLKTEEVLDVPTPVPLERSEAGIIEVADAEDAKPKTCVRYVSPDNRDVFHHGTAKNQMGRILGITVGGKTSDITQENREVVDRILKNLIALVGTDCELPVKRSLS